MSEDDFHLYMLPRAEHTEIYRDKGKMLGMVVLAACFFGGCFLVFYKGMGAGTLPPVKEYLLWAAFGVMGLLLIHTTIQLFDPRPALTVSDDGLLAVEMSDETIPWSAIRSVSPRSYKRSRFLQIELDQKAARGIRLKRWHRLLGVGNKLMGFRHHVINTAMLDNDAEYLAQLMNFYLKKSRPSDE